MLCIGEHHNDKERKCIVRHSKKKQMNKELLCHLDLTFGSQCSMCYNVQTMK